MSVEQQEEELFRQKLEQEKLELEERAREAKKPRHEALEMYAHLEDQEAPEVMALTSTLQEAIKTEFVDTTLIIIAHRLQTVMTTNRVLVLDEGRIVEFDSPTNLLNQGGVFKSMVDGSGDRDTLYRMASAGRPHLDEGVAKSP